MPEEVSRYDRTGIASWYGEMFHGRRTANGEIYDMEALTAAHPTLPLPSLVRVTNLQNGRALVVRVNDRGPYVRGRSIDLSWAVASLLQVKVAGTAPVRIQYLGPAPISGNDSYEREVLARQHWAGPSVGFAASPAKAMRQQRASAAGIDYSQTSSGFAVPPATFDDRPLAPVAAGNRSTASLSPVAPSRSGGHVSAATPSRPPVLAAKSSAKSYRRKPAYIEAGLFPDERLAQRLASTLTDLAPVTLEPETIGGATLHRLRVGPFADQTDAEAAVVRMRAAGLTGAYVQPVPGG